MWRREVQRAVQRGCQQRRADFVDRTDLGGVRAARGARRELLGTVAHTEIADLARRAAFEPTSGGRVDLDASWQGDFDPPKRSLGETVRRERALLREVDIARQPRG